MRYLVLVPDGAGDRNIAELGGKTPLEVAKMETINGLAQRGEIGMVKTIPEGIAPGSDAANLSVMGYDPSVYLTGRSPLEAASIGIEMSDTDVAFRTNLVTLQGEGAYEDLIIADHSSGDITNEEAKVLMEAVEKEFGTETIHFYPGVSYRHAMIVNNGSTDYELTPPHDVLTQRVGEHLPKGAGSQFRAEIMKRSYDLLSKHPINIRRIERGLNPANSLWIWGQGKKPSLSSFAEKYNLKGSAISAVDLIKGIGILAGLDSINVEGATGTIHTNFEGKAQATIAEFEKGKDFVYLHLEAPDECSHQGDLQGKIKSLELIDEKVMKPIAAYLEQSQQPYRILIVPDHRTPMEIRTHSPEPVPFVIYDSRKYGDANLQQSFCEAAAEKGSYFGSGYEMADYFFQKN